jgi:hypothetical protein
MALEFDRVPPRDEYLGIAVLKNIVGQAVMIDVAMGDEQVFQAFEINALPQACFPLRGRWSGIEEHQAAVELGAVEVDFAHHVGGLYGMLLHKIVAQ